MMSSSISTIEGLPRFVSSEEHSQLTSTTPTSFESLPPILRSRVENVNLNLSSNNGDDAHGSNDGSGGVYGLLSDWSNLKLTLILTEREVNFYSAERSSSLVIPYRSISLHAISRPEGQPGSIYCQIDESVENNNNNDDVPRQGLDQEVGGEVEVEVEAIEINIIPDDPTKLDEIFQTLSICASLHPSTNTIDSGAGGGGVLGELGEGGDWTIDDSDDYRPEDGLSSVGRVREIDSKIDPSNRFNPY